MEKLLVEALSKGVIKKEDLVVLALLAMLSEGTERKYFDRARDGVKLSKLLFLAAYGEFDESGRVVGLRREPRVSIDFVVYLFGVTTSTIYDSIERLKRANLIEVLPNDRARYVVHPSLEHVMNALKEVDPELHEVLSILYENYANIENHELTALVNNLIGVNSPEAKAIFFGVSVRKLIQLAHNLRELEQEGKVVDV